MTPGELAVFKRLLHVVERFTDEPSVPCPFCDVPPVTQHESFCQALDIENEAKEILNTYLKALC